MASNQTLSEQLSMLLNISDTSDIISYLGSFQSRQDLEEYLYGLLDEDNAKHRQFVEEYLDNWTPGNKSAKRPNLAKKQAKPHNFEPAKPVKPVEKPEESFWKDDKSSAKPNTSVKKSKTKYTPLFKSKDGFSVPAVHLPGRHKCDCEASKHQLINNCLTCGKIVCEQEGPGPCTFCGTIVSAKGEANVAKKDGLKQAVEHKNKLLDFDQNVEKRTKIIDDEADYFNVENRWLSKEERIAVAKRDKAILDLEKQAKAQNLVSFDFAGRQILRERSTAAEEMEREFELHMAKLGSQSNDRHLSTDCHGQPIIRPIFDGSAGGGLKPNRGHAIGQNLMRLQGNELQEMTDLGNCLSLHQPYASLLMAGIKLHEGRTWYTPIRGPLWIASTAQNPDENQIRRVEESISTFKHPEPVSFPANYPVGALLGCVDLVDCLAQEEYQQMFKQSESDSPYVFICANPRELIVKFPIKGKHKIYKLDGNIHEAAKKSLKSMAELSKN